MSSPASCEMPCLVIVATYKWQVARNSTLISHTYPRPVSRHPVDVPADHSPAGGGRLFVSTSGSAIAMLQDISAVFVLHLDGFLRPILALFWAILGPS